MTSQISYQISVPLFPDFHSKSTREGEKVALSEGVYGICKLFITTHLFEYLRCCMFLKFKTESRTENLQVDTK